MPALDMSTARSGHFGGVNVLMGDGSTRFVSETISTAVWRGMIRVEPDAQKTNAYQENRNLMLSPTTHAVPIPGLEIMANDVRCTHGATVGRVDREQLFYLMARGLSRSEAERLIVRGFFEDVLARVELEPVREALATALEARIPSMQAPDSPRRPIRLMQRTRESCRASARTTSHVPSGELSST